MLEEFHTVLCIFLEEECDANSFMFPGLSCLQKQRLGEESGGWGFAFAKHATQGWSSVRLTWPPAPRLWGHSYVTEGLHNKLNP